MKCEICALQKEETLEILPFSFLFSLFLSLSISVLFDISALSPFY